MAARTARSPVTARHAVAVLLLGGLAACSSPAGPPPTSTATAGDQPFDTYRTDGTTLVVEFSGAPEDPGPCGVDYPAEASETGDRAYVRVRTRPHTPGTRPVPCPAIAQRRSATVRLERPLGSRAVVDGSTGQMLIQPTTAP